jgi:hypothetical protein
MIRSPNHIAILSTQQPIVPTHLAQECRALYKRIASNRCDSCGKTPTVKTRVATVGRIVFCICANCEAVGTFPIDPSKLIVSPEVAALMDGQFPECLLRDLSISGSVQ